MSRYWILLLGIALAAPAGAQFVIEDREDLDFDRPEAWAMAYMSAATFFHGFGPARALEPGAVTLGLEAGHVPRISTEDRRVGFDGTKLEDLNKTPLFGRARLWIGLPADFAIELGWTPQVRINGARPKNLFAVALERPLIERDRWRAGARLNYQTGEVRGDITCDRATAAEPIGSPQNPFGCRAPSNDRFKINSVGLEVAASVRPGDGRLEPFAAFAVTRLEPRTRVNAEVFGVIDRSLLTTRGTVRTLTAGLLGRPADRWEVLGAIAWTPLNVRRPPDRQRSSDDFWSVRLMVRRDLR